MSFPEPLRFFAFFWRLPDIKKPKTLWEQDWYFDKFRILQIFVEMNKKTFSQVVKLLWCVQSYEQDRKKVTGVSNCTPLFVQRNRNF